ncbi:MAG: Slp family lipoprotein [Limisphaerales bacterium]
MRNGKYVGFVMLVGCLAGCAANPIQQNLRNQARPLSLTQVTANPEATRGDTVIWGGRIMNTTNGPYGGQIYVLQLPLRCNDSPKNHEANPAGHFIAISPEHLDPAAYPPGGLITVAGRVHGVRNEYLHNTLCAFPLVQIKQTHLWTSRGKD